MIVDDNSPDIDTGLQEKVMIKNIRVESLLFYSNEIHLYIILWETSLMKVLLRLFYWHNLFRKIETLNYIEIYRPIFSYNFNISGNGNWIWYTKHSVFMCPNKPHEYVKTVSNDVTKEM